MKKRVAYEWRISKQAKDILDSIEGMGFIAGGYGSWYYDSRNSAEPSDIDIFSIENRFEYYPPEEPDGVFVPESPIIDILLELGYEEEKELPNAIQYKPPRGDMLKVQYVKPFQNQWMKTFGTPNEVLEQFDFTVAMVALEKNGEYYYIHYHEDFAKHNKKYRLYIKHINCPIAVAMRVTKYVKKGYYIGPKELIKLFIEWENRDDEYRTQLRDLLEKEGELSPEEWWDMERLLRID